MTRQRKQKLCIKMVDQTVQKCLTERKRDTDQLKICLRIKIKEMNRCHRKSRL